VRFLLRGSYSLREVYSGHDKRMVKAEDDDDDDKKKKAKKKHSHSHD